MKNQVIKISAIILCIMFPFSLFAEQTIDEKEYTEYHPITSSYFLEWGHASVVDTYLSPLKYTGTKIAVSAEWGKAMPQNPERLTMFFDTSIYGFLTDSPAGNSDLYNLGLNFYWTMYCKWRPLSGLTLAAGGGAGFDAGVLYLSRNSNNPASARASIDLTINALASYTLRLGKVPLRFTDRVTLPSLGIFFSPEYGETYYEIYLGNHSGLVNCGWWGNHFSLTNHLTVDVNLGKITLRAGYKFDVRSSYVNHINTRQTSHALTFGIACDCININNGDIPNEKSLIIPAIY